MTILRRAGAVFAAFCVCLTTGAGAQQPSRLPGTFITGQVSSANSDTPLRRVRIDVTVAARRHHRRAELVLIEPRLAAIAGEIRQVPARHDQRQDEKRASDGRIAQYDLKLLGDPKQALPPYDAVLLVSPRRANDDKFLAALKPLIGALDLATMQQANMMVDREADKRTPAQAARWLDARLH